MTQKLSSSRYHLENIYKLQLNDDQVIKEIEFIYRLADEYKKTITI